MLRGNAVQTMATGYAQHTYGSGGESIWVWDLDENNDLLLPSPVVYNCTWQRPPVGRFNHTGVHLVFQRRKAGVVTEAERWAGLEARITTLEDKVKALRKEVFDARD